MDQGRWGGGLKQGGRTQGMKGAGEYCEPADNVVAGQELHVA